MESRRYALHVLSLLALASALLVAGPAVAAAANPLANKPLYVNPAFQAELDGSIATASGAVKKTLQRMRSVGSAYWLDVKAKVANTSSTSLESASGILADAASQGGGSQPPLVVFIVYDLPNRDCHAKASNGEICCNPNPDGTCDYTKAGDCAAGLEEYKSEYIAPLAKTISQYCGTVPMALIVEPDSLPNLATNQGDPHCGNSATTAAYTTGIAYAVNTLAAACPNATLYLDAAHGGWLGWANNLQAFAKAVGDLGVSSHLRGFSTNVANYQPLGIQCPTQQWCLNNAHPTDPCCSDPCKLLTQYNSANNERNYVLELAAALTSAGFEDPHFVVDTGRNGVADMRSDCSNWCNIRGSGVGQLPTTNTSSNGVIDAFLWLKTPGESDGCTQSLPGGGTCARYDAMCGSADSIGSQTSEPHAPEAGAWFDYEVKMLAANAHMDPTPTPPSPPSPPPSPPSPSPSPSPSPPSPSPPPSPGTCSDAYGQCGGKNWSGPTCCVGSCTCEASSVYYSQCIPPAGGSTC